jgi:hypothetical protein
LDELILNGYPNVIIYCIRSSRENMRYKKYFRLIVCVILVFVILKYFNIDKDTKYGDLNIAWGNPVVSKSEKLCFDFVDKKITDEVYGIVNNYAKPEYSLSESEGIIMKYAVMTGDKKLFNKHFNIIKNKMLMDNGLIRWRISKRQEYNSSASA